MSLFPADPYFDDVVVLLPFEGTDGATTTTDVKGNAVTINGSGQIDTAESAFETSSYTTSSYLCDGAATFSAQPLVDAGLASGDFTVEMWYKPDGTASVNDRLFQTRDGDVTTGIYLAHYEFDASQIGFGYDTNGSTPWDFLSGGVSVTNNRWHHIALVRNGSNWTLYKDGVSSATTTFAGSVYLVGSDTCVVGAQTSGLARANGGWIDNFRITARARYTGDFRPPRGPHPTRSISTDNPVTPGDPHYANASLIVPFNGTDGDTTATDFSANSHQLTFAAQAQLDSAQSKYGTTSCLFDGSGDGVTAPDSTTFEFGSGQFTVEAWVRWNGDPGLTAMAIVGHYTPTGDERGWAMNLGPTSGSQFRFSWSTNGAVGGYDEEITTFNPVGDRWYHLAVSRDSTNLYMFIDGSLSKTVANSANFHAAAAPLSIGMWSDGNQPFDGWIEDVRLTKGVCRYTGDFRPTRGPYPIRAVG